MAKVKVPVEFEDLLDVDEAADYIGKGVATIWRWIRDGRISVIHLGGRTLIHKDEIEKLKNDQAPRETDS